MKAKNRVPKTSGQPKPLPVPMTLEQIDAKEREAERVKPLSKDELIRTLVEFKEKFVKLASDATIDTIPILLLLQEVGNCQDFQDELVVNLDGRKIDYCSTRSAMAVLLGRLADDLVNFWHQTDASEMKFYRTIDRYNAGQGEKARISYRLGPSNDSTA